MIACTFEDGGKASLRHVTVGTLVLKDDKILLVKRSEKLSLEAGKWALPGGFVSRDENVLQAAEREAREETGYAIENMTFLCVRHNPDRPHEDRQNIDFIFFCNALSQKGDFDWEVKEMKWFPLDQLPDESSIAFDHLKNIELYQQYKKNNITIPLLQP